MTSPKNLPCVATVCAPAGEATPQRAIRIIYGNVAASKAPHLHAGPGGSHVPALKVAQMHVVSQLPLQRARFSYPAVRSFFLWRITAFIGGFLGKLLDQVKNERSPSRRPGGRGFQENSSGNRSSG